MIIDRNAIIDEKIAKYDKALEKGLLTAREHGFMVAGLEQKRYTPVFVYLYGATNYTNTYAVIDDNGLLLGLYELCLAGIDAGKHKTWVFANGYNKRDINRLYKEYK